MNHKKLSRLFREEGLPVRRRRGCKRVGNVMAALLRRDRRSMDFVAPAFGASRKFRILTINDDCCR